MSITLKGRGKRLKLLMWIKYPVAGAQVSGDATGLGNIVFYLSDEIERLIVVI
jgi:hypothetical protein